MLVALVEVDLRRLGVAVLRMNQVPHGGGAAREAGWLAVEHAGAGFSVGGAELGVALQSFDAMPLAAAGDGGAHTKHDVPLRRRGGVALLAHSVHAEHGKVGFAAGGFMRKFELPHFGHDVGDKFGAVAAETCVGRRRSSVGVALHWPR